MAESRFFGGRPLVRPPSRVGLLSEETPTRSRSPALSRAPSPAPPPEMRKRESTPALNTLDGAESGFGSGGGGLQKSEPLPPALVDDSLRMARREIEAQLPLRARLNEVAGFAAWGAAIALALAQYPMIWVSFWEHLCGVGGNDNPLLASRRTTLAPLWVLWIMVLHWYRGAIYARAAPDVAGVFAHGEVFICVVLAMTLCVNFSTFLHTPGPRLFDLGFLVIPEQARDSPWRPASDVLTAVLPGIALARGLFLGRKQRCRLIASWLRLISIVYAFRCLSVTLTSLPGPAPHCEDLASYDPPRNWHDIATRMGVIMGDFGTCGDLIFSGHAAWTTVTMLVLVKSLRGRRYFLLYKAAGVGYLLLMCTLAIAGRKHYTVDVALGILVAALSFFRFENGWSAGANGGPAATRGPPPVRYDPLTEKKMEGPLFV